MIYVCAVGLDILKIDKTPLIYSISYFNLGDGPLFRGITTSKSPMAMRLGPEKLNDEGALEIAHEICD